MNFKHSYLIILFAVFSSVNVFAQKGFHIGADGAFNGTFIINQNNYGMQEYEYAPTFGYTFGLAAGYNFGRHIGFQAEVKTSKQGQHYADKLDGRDISRKVDLYYTHVPILFKYSGGGDNAIRFYLMVGPQFSFLRNATESFSSPDSSNTVDYTYRFRKNDMQLVFDIGSDFDITKNKRLYASTGLRFNYGLWDINAPAYPVKDPNRTQQISQNALGGVHIGLHYMLTGEN